MRWSKRSMHWTTTVYYGKTVTNCVHRLTKSVKVHLSYVISYWNFGISYLMPLFVEWIIVNRCILRSIPIKHKFSIIETADSPLLLYQSQIPFFNGFTFFFFIFRYFFLFSSIPWPPVINSAHKHYNTFRNIGDRNASKFVGFM